jgi:HEPN domain-containing protein
MNRDDLRELALIRVREARVLLKNKKYEGAYYLCGYVVECGLKACVAKQTRQYDFPDKKTVDESYTHDLTKLVKTAGLELDLEKEAKSNPDFGINWSIVKDWSEKSRYEKHTKKEAQALYFAVVTKKQGVLQWIQRHW